MDHENRNWTDVPDDELEDACWDENPGAIEEHYRRELKSVREELRTAVKRIKATEVERDQAWAERDKLHAELEGLKAQGPCRS